MTGSFEDDIRAAIDTGRALALDFDKLIKIAKDPTAAVTEVEVTLGLELSSIYQIAGIVQGADVLNLLPTSLLPPPSPKPQTPYVTLQTVTVKLLTRTKTIAAVSCAIGFGPKTGSAFDGLTWTIARIGTGNFTVGITGLNVGLDKPTEPKRSLTASSAGAVTVAKLGLDVTGSYPDGRIDIAQPKDKTLILADFLEDFGLHAQDFLKSLTLRGLDFIVEVPSKSGSIKAQLVTQTGAPLVLVQGGGARALLSLAESTLDAAYSATKTDVAITGQFLVMEALTFDISASYKDEREKPKGKAAAPGSTWVFSGAVNVEESWKRLHPGQTPPPKPLIEIADLAELFAPGSGARLPAEISHLAVAELSASYTREGASSTAYRIKGAFDGTWQLAGGIHATLSIDLTDTKKQFAAGFDMDGFAFNLSLDLTESRTAQQVYTVKATIEAIVDRQPLKIAGTYESSGKITLKLEAEVNLAMMIAWFVGSATGQRYYVVPEPWDDILKQIKLPKDLSLAMDTASGDITVTLGKIGFEFLAFSIDSLSLVYTRADAKGGKSGITIELDGRLPGGKALSWDPATETPPEIPGKGGALVEIRTAAAGQHFAFDTVPTGVSDAVETVGKSLAASSWTGTPALMHFDGNAGWLFAAHARVLGQADLEFVFNDPDIYGVLITVKKGKNDKLNVLDGLYAEVLYRKVTDAVGVYEGTLTLPKSIQSMNFGAFEMTLPSFYLAIYTNGDFKIDVGFPYDLDFSKSLSLTVEIYSGAAGFYYAKLDGLDPKGLPQVPDTKGIFSPVTEIGIGLQIGIQKGFESGPLSARFSVMVQGLFQGTFATYHDYASGGTDEFYDMRATVAVSGRLIGAIDFAIIKASVEVRIFVRADMQIVAHRASEVAFAAGVDVKVTVIVNLFLFKISIHLSFEMVVHGSARFGQDTPALWDDAAAVRVFALSAAPAAPAWQPVAPTGGPVPLTVYALPALSAGVDYTETSPSDDRWIYVAQLALSNPAAVPGAGETLANAGDASYSAFLEGVVRWGLFAASGQAQAGGAPVDQAAVDGTTVTRADIAGLLAALADGNRPGVAEIQALFKAGFDIRIGKPATPAKGQTLGVGFFPVLPRMSVSLKLGAGPSVPLEQTPRAAAPLAGASGALPSRALAHLGAPALLAAAAPVSPVEEVLIDYVTLALRAGLQKAHDAAGLFPENGPPPRIAAILAELTPDLGGISGLTSRFMLHGTRQRAESGAMQPLYALTGQQAILGAGDMGADTLELRLEMPRADQALWNIAFEGGGESLIFSSADPDPLVKAPSGLPGVPVLPDPKPALALQPAFDLRPVRFALPAGIAAAGGGGTVWRLPPSLTAMLAAGKTDAFGLYALADGDPEAEGTPVPEADFDWALSLDFDVTRIPLPGANDPKSPEFLKNTYALTSVNQKGLALLQGLIADLSAKPPAANVSALRLGYRTGDGSNTATLTLTDIDFTDTFLVQSNFSTETRPPQVFMALASGAAPAPDPEKALSFLGKLWSGGVTNSGGYFLCYAGDGDGLPQALFQGGGRATLTLAIGLAHRGTGPLPLPPHVNAVLGHGLKASEALFVASDGLTDAHPLTVPGQLAIQLTRSKPAEPGPADLGAGLDQLYNLYAGRIRAIGGQPLPDTEPAVFGPERAEGDSGDLVYRHSFPLVAHAGNLHAVANGGDLGEDENPYSAVGKSVDVGLARVDLFGNLWAGFDDGGTLSPAYDDPLIAPTRLPYLAFSYAFEGAATPRLVVTPVLTPPVYLSGATSQEAARQRKSADLAAYAAAYYQVAAIAGKAQVAVTLATSLLPGVALPVDAATLAADLMTAYKAISAAPIDQVPSAAPPPQQPLTPLSATLDINGLAPDLALPLTASLTIARHGPFAPDVPAESAVRSITIAVPPRTDASGATAKAAGPLSLDGFKAGFNSAFGAQDRVLAAGANRTASSADSGRQLWVLRFGKTGIDPRFDPGTPPAYFAPRPLSNRLISRDLQVPTLAADGTLSPTPGQAIAARDIDLDAVMRRVLAAVDGVFAPQLAVPAALVNRNALNLLADAKKAIVEKLMEFVTEIRLEGNTAPPAGAPALAAAKDRYRQECLIEMGNFYEMASAAVLDLKTSLGGVSGAEPMNLYGQPVPGPGTKSAPSTAENYSLTGGKAAMAPQGRPMAIGLFARNKTSRSTFTADLTFTLGAIEHDLTEVRIGDTDYTSGGWLGFLDPPAALAIGKVEIPIPLRAFPAPPDLVQQRALGRLDPAAMPESAAETLALAKSWVLDGSYRHAFVAQDRVELEVTVNQGSARLALFAAGTDVIDALIAFDTLLPDLQAVFVAEDLAGIRSPDRADNPVLKAALDSFASLATDIAESSWHPISRQGFAALAGGGLVQRSRRFAIEDGVQEPGDPWMTRVSISEKGAADLDIIPTIEIDGYQTQVAAHDATSVSYTYLDAATGKPLTDAEGRALAGRRVAVVPAGGGAPFGTALNVIDRQDGTMAMQILRNARFQEAFRYTTDWVHYPRPVSPQLDIAEPIDITGLAGAPGTPRPLAAHLDALHAALVTGSGTGETLPGMLQLVVGFDFPVTATGPATLALPPVRLPVMLRLPTAVTLGDPGTAPPFLDEVAQEIGRWLTSMDFTPSARADLWARASLGLDVSLFSGATPGGAPILRLRNLRLACAAIALP